MYAVSDRFKAALLKSHTAIFRVDVLRNGGIVETLTDELIGGSITVDATAQVTRSGHAVFVDPTGDLVPLLTTDPLTPYGNELRIWRGIEFPDGDEELVPVITGTIWDTDIDDGPNGLTISCDIFDRARVVGANQFDDIYSIADGTNKTTAIQALVQSRLPAGLTVGGTWTATAETTPLMVLGAQGNNDPMASALALAASMGMYLLFDPLGDPYLAPIPDPLTVASVLEADEDSNLLSLKRRITAESTFNGVVAVGENTGATAPYRATVWDDNPASPTYYLGPFGKRSTDYPNPLINSAAAATAAASGQLLLNLGGTELVTFGTVVNPALAPHDVATINRPRSGIEAVRYVLKAFPVPLDVASPMDAVCRVRRTA